MSTKKIPAEVLLEISDRLKQYYGFKHDNDLAKLFGLSRQDYNNRLKSGSAFNVIATWCVLNDLDCNFILQGKEPTKSDSELVAELEKLIDASKSKSEKKPKESQGDTGGLSKVA